MRKIWNCFAALALVLVLLTLAGCKGNPLPEGMDEAELLDQGREIVALLNEGDWQEVYDRMRSDGRESTSPEEIEEYMQSLLDTVGAYVKESDSMLTGQELEDSGEEYGTVVLYCKHEKKSVMYRIAFSTDMELMGFAATKK